MASLIKSSNKSIHDALRVLARDIQSEDGAANAAIAEAADRISELGIEVKQLEAENTELRKDKDRLDWLSNWLGYGVVGWPEADPSRHATEDGTLADAWRSAIDAAMGEGK